jgi:signal transduction histidine kinase
VTILQHLEAFVGVPKETEAERRRKFIDGLQFRAVTCLIFIVVFVSLTLVDLMSSEALPGVLPLLIFLGMVNVVYWWLGKRNAFPLIHFFGHWLVDEFTISTILFDLGGLSVPYGFLAFVMIVVTSATFVSKRASFIVAGGAAVSSLILAAVELSDIAVPPMIWSMQLSLPAKIASVVFAVLFYFIFAYLAGTLAEQLKTANHALTVARNQIAAQNQELETKVRDRTTELERRNSEIEEFVHVVTHDLKNVSIGTTEVARLLMATDGRVLSTRGLRYAEHLVEDSRQMNQMLASLLGIFRIDRDRQNGAIVDIRELVDGVLRTHSERIERKSIRVIVDELPIVRADESRLTHVLSNLLDNAVKYVGDKARREIQISSDRLAQAWAIRVADTGIGMSSEHLDRIFQLYYRGPHQAVNGQVQHGEGVGLAMCRRIVERWGGKIWVESTLGVGTTFGFTIPDEMKEGEA